MFEDLFKEHVLGEVLAWIAVYEWQYRGLPHVHMLTTLKERDKPRTAADVDRLVRAENADPVGKPDCMRLLPRICCREAEFCEVTELPPDGYPTYRRPNNGRAVQMDGQTLDNAWIVPYNPFLTLRHNAHMNVEICALIQASKYQYKNVYKGVDKASLVLHRGDIASRDDRIIDEIKLHLDLRHVCPPEAARGIFGFSSKQKLDTVE
ncbi:hypothetical protein ANCCEY_08237 [Ancylostoma ceylanicum]|uniref:Helitron helicase-like domain-containing protein n=2 Tax=Ancylostoma ceylanicum TaxID=53326 RepID=A0A0D6LL18_9BILA|nr:hypothetical protein ANCCEY_08237 [Ancylostoma ceylanicum]EYB90861.1 hypothetical protein Y032_0213g2297 [Ancylostoma ceylanicum]